MIEHYNAFISYKHAPEDIKVAESIQRGLERFHVPSKIRKKSGMKKIERIFRDKDELPITSDLSDDISYALEHADYLIVICSTHTKESMWVPREIEYFLKNHSRRQILTVLVDGEPQDVIPDILLSEERIINNEKGEPQTIKVALEPLSCDYRISIKQANREELPRLAAALLGCSYDELMNRHRQYKMQRLSLVFAGVLCVALAFGGYMLYSRNQIKESYQESLRNQSRYLANESKQLLENERRITALQLALHALPQEEERPVTAEAVRALTDATLSYVSLSGTNINAVWNYQMPNRIQDYMVSPEGTTLAALDIGNVVNVWKTDTHELIFTTNYAADTIYGIQYLFDDQLIIWTSDHVRAYDIHTSELVWEQNDTEHYSLGDHAILTKDGNILLRSSANLIYQLNSMDGSVQKQIQLPKELGEELISIYDWAVSPKEEYIAFSAFVSARQYIMGVYNVRSGQTVYTEVVEDRIHDLYWADNEHLMTAYSVNDGEFSGSSNNYSFLSTDHTWIRCYAPADLALIWEYDFTSNEVMINSSFLYLPATDSIAYYCGNIADIYDLETGECLYHHNVNDSIIDISDRDEDGWPLYLTKSGGMGAPEPAQGPDSITMVKQFTDDLDKAVVNQGVYVHPSLSREIIYYGLYVSDEDWVEYDDSIVLSNVSKYDLNDSVLAILTSEDAGITLTLYDPNTDSLLRQIILTDSDSGLGVYDYYLLGIQENFLYLSYSDILDMTLLEVDIQNGSFQEYSLPNAYTPAQQYMCIQDGKVFYTGKPDIGVYTLSIYDLASKEVHDYTLPEGYSSPKLQPIYIPDHNCVYYADAAGDSLISLEDGSISSVELPANWNETGYAVVNPENPEELAISDHASILILHTDGTIQTEINCAGLDPLGLMFCDTDWNHSIDSLLVPYNNGDLYRYSVNDGSFIGKSDISTYINAAFPAEFHMDETSHLLYMQINTVMDVIDMDSWVEVICMDHCLGHHVPSDRFITTSYTTRSENRIGYFRHYTLEELKSKGWEILQGTDLTVEQKSGYGIE